MTVNGLLQLLLMIWNELLLVCGWCLRYRRLDRPSLRRGFCADSAVRTSSRILKSSGGIWGYSLNRLSEAYRAIVIQHVHLIGDQKKKKKKKDSGEKKECQFVFENASLGCSVCHWSPHISDLKLWPRAPVFHPGYKLKGTLPAGLATHLRRRHWLIL